MRNPLYIRLPKLYADFLRAELGEDPTTGAISVDGSTDIGKYILSISETSITPISKKDTDNVLLALSSVRGANTHRFYLFIPSYKQTLLFYYIKAILYAKSMIWIAISQSEGHTAKFGLEQFLVAHQIRNSSMNLDHLLKMTYRNERSLYLRSKDPVQNAVNQEIAKFRCAK